MQLLVLITNMLKILDKKKFLAIFLQRFLWLFSGSGTGLGTYRLTLATTGTHRLRPAHNGYDRLTPATTDFKKTVFTSLEKLKDAKKEI
jgi:hypothetical protein